MALCDLHWKSDVLGKNVGAYVLIPDQAKPPLRTFYLLHGLSDDYTIWIRRTGLERYAARHDLMIVMPDGYRGFYTDNAAGPPYATYIAKELVPAIERIFPARAKRASRGIGGLSMGGYGALRLALGFPNLFATATSHSGAVLHGSRNQRRADSALDEGEFRRIFGDKPAGSAHDLVTLARKAKSRGKLPKIRIDCGVEDTLLDDNRLLHDKLASLRIKHEYEEFPGGHDWDYWDAHVQDALAFHARHLK